MPEEDGKPFVSNYPRSATVRPKSFWRYADRFVAFLQVAWGLAILIDLIVGRNFYLENLGGLAIVGGIASLYWCATIPKMIIAVVVSMPCTCLASMACDGLMDSNLMHETHNFVWLPGVYAVTRVFILVYERHKTTSD